MFHNILGYLVYIPNYTYVNKEKQLFTINVKSHFFFKIAYLNFWICMPFYLGGGLGVPF